MAILHLLNEAPMHGYKIMRMLETRAGGFYSASAGTIYPALQELLRQDFITFESKSAKKTYFINENGQAKLKSFASRHSGDFWGDWQARWVWQGSDEASQLRTAIENWESQLRRTIKSVRKKPEETEALITFIKDMTEQLKNDNE